MSGIFIHEAIGKYGLDTSDIRHLLRNVRYHFELHHEHGGNAPGLCVVFDDEEEVAAWVVHNAELALLAMEK